MDRERRNLLGRSPGFGELIEVNRPAAYQHWAVCIGGGEVVHLTGDARSPLGCSSSASTSSASSFQGAEGKVFHKAVVKRDKLNDVVGNSVFRIDNGPSPFTPEEIKERALSRVGETGYNLFFHNCEHFAKWCRYNIAHSTQVARAQGAMANAVAREVNKALPSFDRLNF